MRSIKQPGAPVAERIQWVEARGRAFSFTLEAGVPLLEAARRGFAAEGFASGALNFGRGALGPFGYVMPALSKTGENAAFYSDTYRPKGVTHTKLGSMTLGVRDGAPFFHCHGLWTEADGRASGGHMLPDETIVAEPFTVEAFGLDGPFIANAPKFIGSFGVLVDRLGPWFGGLQWRKLGPYPISDGNRDPQDPGYSEINLDVGYKVTPQVRVQLSLFNLFNTKANSSAYFYGTRLQGEPAEGVEGFQVHPIEPLAGLLKVTATFR